MTIAIASATGGGGTSSATVSKPSGKWTDGNLLLAQVSYTQIIFNNPGTIVPPSGWTLTTGTTNSGNSAIFRRVCSSEPSSYSFSVTPDSGDTVETCSVSVIEISGQDSTTPVNATATEKSGNSKTASFNSVTPSVDNCQIIAFLASVTRSATATFPAPSGFTTERGDQGTTGSDSFVAYTNISDKAQTTHAAITPGNVSISTSASAANTFWDTHVIAIAPAAGGTTFNDTITESGSASDSYSATATFSASLTYTGSASDSQSGVVTFNPSVAESGSAMDSYAATATFTATIHESGLAADSYAAVATFVATLTESGNILDAFTPELVMDELITEALSSSDSYAALAIFAAALQESGSIDDSYDALATFVATLTETGDAEDFYDVSGGSVVETLVRESAPFIANHGRMMNR